MQNAVIAMREPQEETQTDSVLVRDARLPSLEKDFKNKGYDFSGLTLMVKESIEKRY